MRKPLDSKDPFHATIASDNKSVVPLERSDD